MDGGIVALLERSSRSQKCFRKLLPLSLNENYHEGAHFCTLNDGLSDHEGAL